MLDAFIIGIVIACVGLIIAAMRRGSSVLGSKSRRLQSVSIAGSPQETLKAIIRFAQQAGYKIAAMDEAKGQLVLEEAASATSWGFFFPVSVTRGSDGSTLIEVGIKSKLFQIGPIMSRSHDRCINGIKAALFAKSSS
jgi:hypothetical protein